jgi:hypothetical protein
VVRNLFSAAPLLAVLVGAVVGGGVFLLVIALRGLPRRPPGGRSQRLERQLRELVGTRGAAAVIAGIAVLIATRWVVAGIGTALLVLGWRSLGGAASERKAVARLEGLATWT